MKAVHKRLGRGKKAAFAAVAVVLVFSFLEILLRALGFEYDTVPRYLSFHQDKYMFGRSGDRTFLKDDLLFWRLSPDQPALGINPQGYRGAPFRVEKPEGVKRILCLGCSVTFGLHEPRSYVDDLAEALKGGGTRELEVFNLGVPGYSSLQGLRLLEKEGLRYKPDLVTLLFGWNDHWLMKSLPDREQRPPPALAKALAHSRVYQFLYHLFMAVRESNLTGKPEPGAYRVSPESFRKNLCALVATARKQGAEVLLITAPTSILEREATPAYLVRDGLIAAATDLPALHETYNEQVRRVARELDVPLADCARVLLPSVGALMMQDGIHPNREGHRRMAGVIKDALIKAYPDFWEEEE